MCVTNVCLRVPFYGAEYVCYSFCSAAYERHDSTCVRTLAQRLRLEGSCLVGGKRVPPVSAMCLNNKAPSALSATRLRAVFSYLCGRCPMSSRTRVALRTGPSSLASKGVGSLHALPIGQLDVNVRAFSRRGLHLLHHHRQKRRTVQTVGRYRSGKVRGVDVSLVCKLPTRVLSR